MSVVTSFVLSNVWSSVSLVFVFAEVCLSSRSVSFSVDISSAWFEPLVFRTIRSSVPGFVCVSFSWEGCCSVCC